MKMSRLTRDGTAEPVSPDKILRRANRGRKIFIFPVQLTTSRIDNLTRLILALAICDEHTTVYYRGEAQRYTVYLHYSPCRDTKTEPKQTISLYI